MALVISIIIVLLFGGWLYITIKYYDSSFVTYVYHWDYRVLRRLRQRYNWSMGKTPPDSYETFYNDSINYIANYLEEHHGFIESQRDRVYKAENLTRMLSVQQYIDYYFTEYERFTGKVYYKMFKDFRLGDYKQRDYSYQAALRKILPLAIKSSDKAFELFLKVVDVGWFDKNNGMYIIGNGIEKQHIGRAIYWICKKSNISSPEKVFAPFWGVNEGTVADWCRIKSRNPERTQQIDKIVDDIMSGR